MEPKGCIFSLFSDPPSVKLSVLPPSSSNIPLTLYCDLENFYPEEVSVSWLQNGTVLPNPPATEQNPDGTYRTRHYYTLSPGEREQGGKVECAITQPGAVNSVSGSADLETLDPKSKTLIINNDGSILYSTYSTGIICIFSPRFLSDEPPVLTKSAKASVALMCISLVLVFLLCFGFSWRRRDGELKKNNQGFS